MSLGECAELVKATEQISRSTSELGSHSETQRPSLVKEGNHRKSEEKLRVSFSEDCTHARCARCVCPVLLRTCRLASRRTRSRHGSWHDSDHYPCQEVDGSEAKLSEQEA